MVKKDFVIDYTSAVQNPLMEYEKEGFDYRYVYGHERLSVTISPVTNAAGNLIENDEIHLYYHQDRLGTTDFLSSALHGKVTSWTMYDEWGNITHNAVLKCGHRELDLVKAYATHDYDAVLGQYYAKARMYDPQNKRFTARDLIKGNITDPLTLTPYLYVIDNPLRYVDLLGLTPILISPSGHIIGTYTDSNTGTVYVSIPDIEAAYPEINKTISSNQELYIYSIDSLYVPDATFSMNKTASSGNLQIGAGLYPAGHQGMIERNIDIINHRSKTVEALDILYFRDQDLNYYVELEYFNELICVTLGADKKIQDQSLSFQPMVALIKWYNNQIVYVSTMYGGEGSLTWIETTRTATVFMTANGYSGYAEFQEGVNGSYIGQDNLMYVNEQLLWAAFGFVIDPPTKYEPFPVDAVATVLTLGAGRAVYKVGKVIVRGAGTSSRGANAAKTVDDILEGATPGRITSGRTTQYVKTGSYDDAVREFDSLNPSNIKEINTIYGPGRTGTLSDGRTITVRPGSTDGRPTLEIRGPNRRGVEIRYGE